jgi:heptaprenyl diphosphate synthase
MNLQEIYRDLKEDLQHVEKALERAIASKVPELQDSSLHLLRAGGKRMRPVFVLLAGRFGQYDLSRLEKVAVALELIHMATLVHDDVIDDADLRRGRKTVRAQWNNRMAMVTGDYIFAQALQKIGQLRDAGVHQILSQAIYQMCLGEIDQIRDLYSSQLSLKDYFYRIKRKTALLMAISCQLGAYVSNAEPRIVQHLYQFGYRIGMAFQMVDDVLDFTGDEKTLGKPAGSDLRQGNVTLPVIYALHHLAPEKRERLQNFLESQGQSGSLEEMIELVRHSGGISYTLELSQRYLAKALASLEHLPPTGERESLRLIAEFTVRRSY